MSQGKLNHTGAPSAPAARVAQSAAGAKPNGAKPPTPPSGWGIRAAEFYAQLKEQPVGVMLVDGKVIDGVLVGVDTYDLVLRTRENRQILVAKHAIKYVMPTQGAAGAR